ncbi:MAG: diaminobutyrate acetyltransferase [Pseudomonadota bacterium]
MTEPAANEDGLILRAPTPEDGADVWELIRDSGPLDENSLYCNLVQCEHFADTCVIAELEGEIVGWVSGLIPPQEPETLFIWQVAVSRKARGMGVARRMLEHLLARPSCEDVTQIKTTITADNEASWALFNSFADKLDATLERDAHYEKEEHFAGRHDTEYMVTIADFEASKARERAEADSDDAA